MGGRKSPSSDGAGGLLAGGGGDARTGLGGDERGAGGGRLAGGGCLRHMLSSAGAVTLQPHSLLITCRA